MNTNKYPIYGMVAMLMAMLLACDTEFLEKRPSKNIAIPKSLEDFQAILDNQSVMNIMPGLQFLASDDYVTTNEGWLALPSETEQNAYIWEYQPHSDGGGSADWSYMYRAIFHCNVVLEGLNSLPDDAKNSKEFDRIRGSALFFRAHAYFHLAQLFAPPYADENLGEETIPLHLFADVNDRPTYVPLVDLYVQIIDDLKKSEQLLDIEVSPKTRPSKLASIAMLARVYLVMGDYVESESYSNIFLEINNDLLDYNDLIIESNRPFPNENKEIIFYSHMIPYGFLFSSLSLINDELIDEYEEDDLRKGAYLLEVGSNQYMFKGSYTGNSYYFGGIAVDEVYLINIESLIQNGNLVHASERLSFLLSKRIRYGGVDSIYFNNKESAMERVKAERRKSLVARGLRWSDQKRINRETPSIRVSRQIQGIEYVLEPNSTKYMFPIPAEQAANF